MDSFSKLDDALQTLAEIGEGVVVADEQHDGKMKYIVCTEQDCYKLYTAGSKLHAVNFSCISSASSRLFVDWEPNTKSLYTLQNESKQHSKMIRIFIKAVMNMLLEMGITRFISWVVENRTRLDPDIGKWKPSFHIYSDLWFENNYEMMAEFVKKAMVTAGLSRKWIDFGVYQPKSLLRMIGVSSKPYHLLPLVEEQDQFLMCFTSSMSDMPDVTEEHMKRLNIEWLPRQIIRNTKYNDSEGTNVLKRVLQLLKQHGESVTRLEPANSPGSFYGVNSVGRNCLTYPKTTHHAGGNRCITWLNDCKIFYRCLDPDHREKVMCLGEL